MTLGTANDSEHYYSLYLERRKKEIGNVLKHLMSIELTATCTFVYHVFSPFFYTKIVGPTELCQRISDGLRQSIRERKLCVSVHQCESISDIIKSRADISVDFIIFAFDSRTSLTLSEVEANICTIDEYYLISGSTCLVNCNGIFNTVGLIHKSKQLCHKYNIRFLSANVFNAQACVNLGNRILNVAEGILGLNSGIPIIGTVTRSN